jgi:acyl-CoA thioester hydrolase
LSENASNPLAGFPVVITLPVQWGDEDAFCHVNNTVYLRWCEAARVAYLMRIGLWQAREGEGVGPILASLSCDYKRPVKYPDTVRVGARVTKIGNSSFRMEHKIVSDGLRQVAAEAHSTLVVFDYSENKAVRVSHETRSAIAKLEGQDGKSL